MSASPSLGALLSEGAPVVRLFHTALGRDPTAVELDRGRSLLRETGALLPLASALADGPEFRSVHGRSGDAEKLVRQACSPETCREVALLPGLVPGLPPDEQTAFDLWVKLYDQPAPSALDPMPHRDGPRVSIAMAVGDTEVEAALRSIESLDRQVYPHWRLHLATRLLSPWPRQALTPRLGSDRVTERACQGGDPLRTAIEAALADAGDGLVAVLEPGDILAATALDEVAALFDPAPDCAMLTTDEDAIDLQGQRSLPRFKPAYSPFTNEPVGQLAVYRAGLLRAAVASPDNAFPNPMQAIASAAARLAGERLFHHPAILCHRPPSRIGRTRRLAAPASSRSSLTASIVVPTRDRADLLRVCAEGVLGRTSYPEVELLIVDNGSDEPEALALLEELSADRRVRILRAPGSFNFARLNNLAAEAAKGELLVLLNNDIEIREASWLLELERLASQAEIGVAGARLLYPDGRVQHAGILLGPEGRATHVGRHFPADDPGYLGRFEQVTELSAVTGACLAIRREVWRRVGGMDERLAVTFNDVDLCLRVRSAGLRVVWTPHATLVHHEARSRGLESEDAAKLERFNRERALLRDIWGEAVEADPFLNANLLAVPSGHLVATRPRRPPPWRSGAIA